MNFKESDPNSTGLEVVYSLKAEASDMVRRKKYTQQNYGLANVLDSLLIFRAAS